MSESTKKGNVDMTKELIAALAKAQIKIQPPAKDGNNAHFKNKYCTLDSIYTACRLPLAENGLTISHSVQVTGEKYFLSTTLYHTSGESISNSIPIFIDKATPQGFGSALTYARRYAITSLLTLPSDEDDDGNQAEKESSAKQNNHTAAPLIYNPPMNGDFLSKISCFRIEQMIKDHIEQFDPIYRQRLLAFYKVSELGQIASEHEGRIMDGLAKKIESIQNPQKSKKPISDQTPIAEQSN